MPYNVGPEFTRRANDSLVCEDCNEWITPEWDGCEGAWRCPCCYNELPSYTEQES